MPKYALDVETQGLEGNLILGTISSPKRNYTYYTKEQLWQKCIQLGQTHKKQGHTTLIYCHNLRFDFSKIVDINDPNVRIHSSHPPIYQYGEHTNQGYNAYIYFLDLYSIFPFTLKEVGNQIGYPKTEPPTELWEKMKQPTKQEYTQEELNQIKQYNINDNQVVLHALNYIYNKMKTEGHTIRRIVTAGQLSMVLFNQTIRKHPEKTKILQYTKKGDYSIQYHPCRNWWIHYQAYRGGYIKAFQYEIHNNATYIDCNSMYPYIATKVPFPNLKTPITHYRLETKEEINNIIQHIGISQAYVHIPKNDYGILPVYQKTEDENEDQSTMEYYPNHESDLIGTWTNNELRFAQSQGATIKYINQTTIYEALYDNPLAKYMIETYQKRKNNPQDNVFYKLLMNSLIGKYGQWTKNEETITDSTEKYHEMEANGYYKTGETKTGNLYTKDHGKQQAKWYAPIIPATINAQARIELIQTMQKIPIDKLLYCSTDSIMFKDMDTTKFNIGKEMGQWKIVNQGTAQIYGKHCYKIDNQIKASGISKAYMTPEGFTTGIIEYKKQIPLIQKNKDKFGQFKKETANLNKRMQKEQETNEKLKDQKKFIDQKLNQIDINQFIEKGYL